MAVELVVHGLVDPLGDGAEPAVEGEVHLALVHGLPRGPGEQVQVQVGPEVMVRVQVQVEVEVQAGWRWW